MRDQAAPKRKRVMFALAHQGFYRNFEGAIMRLAARGHDVRVVYSKDHETITLEDVHVPGGGDISLRHARVRPGLRISRARVERDIMFYARPEFEKATDLRARFPDHQKDMITAEAFAARLEMIEQLSKERREEHEELLRSAERRAWPALGAMWAILKFKPDIVVVSPLVNFASREVEFVKAARALGVRTILAVASWDNLTNKGVMKVHPDEISVWNEDMADEARSLHGFTGEVHLTGATVFDWWFENEEIWPRERFLGTVGFSEDRPVVAYMCSSVSIGGRHEMTVVRDWARAVRGAEDKSVRHANLLVRPHPMNLAPWEKFLRGQEESDKAPKFQVYPQAPTHPTSAEQRAIFFNTLYHASAIVGLNTSAMIEAAILGKPVLTFRGHAGETSQVGNMHFDYLAQSGFVDVSPDLPSHLEMLASRLKNPEKHAARAAAFVARFVRPLGRDVSASDALADVIASRIGPP